MSIALLTESHVSNTSNCRFSCLCFTIRIVSSLVRRDSWYSDFRRIRNFSGDSPMLYTMANGKDTWSEGVGYERAYVTLKSFASLVRENLKHQP